jgi:hypothetical protein
MLLEKENQALNRTVDDLQVRIVNTKKVESEKLHRVINLYY